MTRAIRPAGAVGPSPPPPPVRPRLPELDVGDLGRLTPPRPMADRTPTVPADPPSAPVRLVPGHSGCSVWSTPAHLAHPADGRLITRRAQPAQNTNPRTGPSP